jgi:chemotaxis response regulator CheB
MENMQDATSILRVYVVEDSMPICERIVQMINEARDMQVVGTADNASGAITGICACMPHAVILDLRLANSSGLTVLRDIARAHGADAFLDKSNDFMRITEILHTWRPSPTPAAARLN